MLATNLGYIKLIIYIAIAMPLFGKQLRAQVVVDGTVGSQTNVAENFTTITKGTRVGKNLFHSFKQFSLATGSTAYFDNPIEIENIFSRVTGGGISEIDGAIAANGSANLFLLNPAGIIFGANAQLNLGGSFIAATSESLIFKDGSKYSAVEPLTRPLLTIASPIGLQYGAASGAIASSPNGGEISLAVTPGNTLALLGNDVALRETSLSAFNGKVQIGSIASGRVNLESGDRGWNLNYGAETQFARIEMDSSFIETSGVGGITNLRGEAIDLANSGFSNFTLIDGRGGEIELIATELVKLDNSFLSTQVGSELNNLAIAGTGGDIRMSAPRIEVTNGAIVSAGTLSSGRGGNITLEAAKVVRLSGETPAFITTSTQGSGAGGQLKIATENLIVRDGSQIQAFAGEGRGGAIAIEAAESVELSGKGTRNFGGIELTFNSGLLASSGNENLPFELQPDGKSGDLSVNTPRLLIKDDASISVSNFGAADAGNIEIDAAEVDLLAGEIIANTASGRGGSIILNAKDSVILQQGGRISTDARRNGNGGNIDLTTDNLVLLNQSEIAADAQAGSGGNIEIETQGYFISRNSEITASSNFGADGIVDIVTLDADSNIETTQLERSPIAAESYITTGCGVRGDFTKNQFRSVGRGGLPPSIRERSASPEVLEDLGFPQPSTAINIPFPESAEAYATEKDRVVEATNWIINSDGKVELIAQSDRDTGSRASCQL